MGGPCVVPLPAGDGAGPPVMAPTSACVAMTPVRDGAALFVTLALPVELALAPGATLHFSTVVALEAEVAAATGAARVTGAGAAAPAPAPASLTAGAAAAPLAPAPSSHTASVRVIFEVDVDGETVWRGRGGHAPATAAVAVFGASRVTLRCVALGDPTGLSLLWLHPRVVVAPGPGAARSGGTVLLVHAVPDVGGGSISGGGCDGEDTPAAGPAVDGAATVVTGAVLGPAAPVVSRASYRADRAAAAAAALPLWRLPGLLPMERTLLCAAGLVQHCIGAGAGAAGGAGAGLGVAGFTTHSPDAWRGLVSSPALLRVVDAALGAAKAFPGVGEVLAEPLCALLRSPHLAAAATSDVEEWGPCVRLLTSAGLVEAAARSSSSSVGGASAGSGPGLDRSALSHPGALLALADLAGRPVAGSTQDDDEGDAHAAAALVLLLAWRSRLGGRTASGGSAPGGAGGGPPLAPTSLCGGPGSVSSAVAARRARALVAIRRAALVAGAEGCPTPLAAAWPAAAAAGPEAAGDAGAEPLRAVHVFQCGAPECGLAHFDTEFVDGAQLPEKKKVAVSGGGQVRELLLWW
jgi:hypothetical protein